MGSEPIMWVRANGGQYVPPQITRPGPDGEPVVEKLPATARPPDDHPLAGEIVRRWELMLDHCGNVNRVVYSGGASDYQVDGPNYGASLRARHRRLGWFDYGMCPLVLIKAGQLDPMYVAPEIRTGHACEKGTYSSSRPCKHTLAEEAHRKMRNAKREAKRADAFKSEVEKMAKTAADNQAQQNATMLQLVQQQSEFIKALIGGNGQWPMTRPNLTPEQYETALKVSSAPVAEAPASEDELERMLREADEPDAVPGDDAPMVSAPKPPEVPFDATSKKKGR